MQMLIIMQVLSWMHLNTGFKPLVTPPRLRPGVAKVSALMMRWYAMMSQAPILQ